MRVVVLGASGMLGSAVFSTFHNSGLFDVWGTLRDNLSLRYFSLETHAKLICNIDVLDQSALLDLFERFKPDVVINCVGLVKQLASVNDPLVTLPINAMLPHRLAKLCMQFASRLIHISTDCVFSGKQSFYSENDCADAIDLYGKSKFIGELTHYPHAITLRTSIIGHELHTQHSLIDWFLSQRAECKGYINAIFSGLPTVELARVMMESVIPRPELSGIYHVAAKPINKYDLLKLVAEVYHKKINIIPDESLIIDRSLNAQLFTNATGYTAPEWPELIKSMCQSQNLTAEV